MNEAPTVYRIILRHKFPEAWGQLNPVLRDKEVGLELITGRVKLGDGKNPWSELDYATTLPPVIHLYGQRTIHKGYLRRSTKAEFAELDPFLWGGEVAQETDTGRTKVAHQKARWSEIRYLDEIEQDYIF